MKFWQAALLTFAAMAALTACGSGTSSQPATPAPTAIPTATPQPTPSPTPATVPNPLTGLSNGDFDNTRPVAVTLRTADAQVPQWGVADADVMISGLTEGKFATQTVLYARCDDIAKLGPVGPGRDLTLQLVLPLNAVPVHIDKNVYASNLLNVLHYQDLDGLHIGKAGFAMDEPRAAAGAPGETCWYTTGALIHTGLTQYGATTAGANMPLFHFAQRPAPAVQNGTDLTVTFSEQDSERLVYAADAGVYQKYNADGSPQIDDNTGAQVAFDNVLVLYASSGIKDDGVTRQYDLTGGTGLYLTDGAWETIAWNKGDATAPLVLTDTAGKTLDVNPGKSYIAVWGGHYGQALRLLGADGAEQSLPARMPLLSSAADEVAAAAAMEEQRHQQQVTDAQNALTAAQQQLEAARQAAAAAPDNAEAAAAVTAAEAALAAAQAMLDALTTPITVG